MDITPENREPSSSGIISRIPSQPLLKGRRFIAVFLAVVFAVFFGAAASGWFLFRMYQTLPTLDQLENIEPPLSSKVMGRDGSLIHEFSIEKRSWVSLDRIPQNLMHAVIAITSTVFGRRWMVTGASSPTRCREVTRKPKA